MHELIHLRRGDLLAGWFQTIVQILWWFHPAVWLASRCCSHERERCCDDAVVRTAQTPSANYAQCLIDTARLVSSPRIRWEATVAGMSGVSSLRTRMQSIMRAAGHQTPGWLVGTTLVLAGILILPGALPTRLLDETQTAPRIEISADEIDQTRNQPAAEEVAVPKVVAMTWQQGDSASGEFSEIPLWTTDGQILEQPAVEKLRADIRGTEVEWMNQPKSRPLIFVFDPGTALTDGAAGVRAQVRLSGGATTSGGSSWNRSPGKTHTDQMYAISSAAQFLMRDQQFKWPDQADVIITYPIENRVLLATLTEIPRFPVQITKGARWYIDQTAGYDPSAPRIVNRPPDRFPAGVLETATDGSLDLINYGVLIYRKGDDRPIRDSYTTMQDRNGATWRIDVSSRFPPPEEFDRIEIYRTRSARAVIPKVKIRTDLLPDQQ